jgi:hypothetical protein
LVYLVDEEEDELDRLPLEEELAYALRPLRRSPSATHEVI